MAAGRKERNETKLKLSLKIRRKCYVCDLDGIEENFVQHMEDHTDDLKMFKFSNDMNDCCKTSCKICGKLVPLQGMRSHTKSVHGMQITKYKTKFNQAFYDIVEKVFHR